jgi:bifunctional non-homologous end joining protein LigD
LSAGLAEQIGGNAILDGEIVYLDGDGISRFNHLMFGRARPVFAAFDLLWLNGRDLRGRPLLERKRRMARLLAPAGSHVLLVEYVQKRGTALFQAACDRDLEGIVGKWVHGRYQTDGATSWVKIKNRDCIQAEGRRDLFEGRRRAAWQAVPKPHLGLR